MRAVGGTPGAAPGSDRPTAVRLRILGLLLAFSFLSWFNRLSMSTAGDLRIMEELSLTPTQMGSVYSAFIGAYMLGMIPDVRFPGVSLL